jgi:hypothetical protein
MTNRPYKPIEGTIVGDAIAVKPNAFIENGIKVNCITRVGANGEKTENPISYLHVYMFCPINSGLKPFTIGMLPSDRGINEPKRL